MTLRLEYLNALPRASFVEQWIESDGYRRHISMPFRGLHSWNDQREDAPLTTDELVSMIARSAEQLLRVSMPFHGLHSWNSSSLGAV